MMTEQLGVSMITAPLDAIDRRALSQAWYSALRLAREGEPSRICARARSMTHVSARAPVSQEADGQYAERSKAHAGRRRMDVNRIGPDQPVGALRVWDRRAPRSAIARRIERALLEPGSKAKRATFSIGRGGGRIHVVLHSTSDRVAIVALCPPALRTIVARALAQARFALATRGVVVTHEEQGDWRCF